MIEGRRFRRDYFEEALVIKNAFTGEIMTKERKKTQKEIDDETMVPFGDRGEFRPASRGRTYDLDGLPSMTDQTQAASTDINNIMKRYEKTGQLEDLIRMGMAGDTGMFYGDFTDAPTFQEALNITLHAQEQFGRLDAHIRNRFENDPAKFLEFATDEKNKDEMRKMGLLKPQKEEEITLKDLNRTLKDGFSGASKSSPRGKTAPPSPAHSEGDHDS